jgi:hypothetical protein
MRNRLITGGLTLVAKGCFRGFYKKDETNQEELSPEYGNRNKIAMATSSEKTNCWNNYSTGALDSSWMRTLISKPI